MSMSKTFRENSYEEGKFIDSEQFEAPIEEEAKEPIEVSDKEVSILGIKIPRNPEPTERVPQAGKFKDFSVDDFSLDLLQRIAKAVVLDQPLLLEGEAACGKSYTIEYLAYLCNREVYRISLNGQTDVTDLIGKWVPRTETLRKKIESILRNPEMCKSEEARRLIEAKIKLKSVHSEEIAPEKEKPIIGLTREEMEAIAMYEGIEIPESEWVWQDGDIPRQMQSGAWSILDEVNTCEPQILVRLNAVLERGGQLVLHEDGSRIVKRHPDFRLFATVNPPGGRYRGRVPLSAEWISRWNYQNIGSLPKEIRALRFAIAEGLRLSEITSKRLRSRIKPETLRIISYEPLPQEIGLVDYYGSEWIIELAERYSEFIDTARKMLENGEIAKDQSQIFDFDQRDDQRFREYLRKFHEPGRMVEVIQEALEYCIYNKLKDPKDRQKLKDIAEGLIQIQEPKEILLGSEEEIRKRISQVKLLLKELGITIES